jgi:hypothetical protein
VRYVKRYAEQAGRRRRGAGFGGMRFAVRYVKRYAEQAGRLLYVAGLLLLRR